MNKTYITKLKDITHNWHLIDLKGKVLGRICSDMSKILQGKHKVYYSPHLDCGDYIVAINASLIKVTGRKEQHKFYHRHSLFPGGFKTTTIKQQRAKDPRKIISLSIKNMLPKNKMRDQWLARLKIFAASEHNYQDKFNKKLI